MKFQKGLGGLALVVRGWRELDEALKEAGYVSNGPLFEASNGREKTWM